MTIIDFFRFSSAVLLSRFRGGARPLLAKFLHFTIVALASVLLGGVCVKTAESAEVVWVEDATPSGASLTTNNDTWTWVSSTPAPFSGSAAHQSQIAVGTHQHYFSNSPLANQLAVGAGDLLFVYVYLDPANPPTEIMLQWNDGGWEHRAYWGSNRIGWGVDGTNSRRYMGPLPISGQWVRLEVPASQVGLEGRSLKGMAFTLHDGRVTWDRAGKISGVTGNTPPTVTLTAPANNSTYPVPASISLNATANDSDGISKVEFYNGAQLLGTDATSPYSWALASVAAGRYSYTAKAFDTLNASTTSAAVTVTVSETNTPPTVSLTAPANGSSYTAPAAITLNATASDNNGISKVEFYNGASLLGTDTTSPYSWALTNVAAGSYSYTAKAFDSLNATTTSAAVSVSVNAAPVRTETLTYYHNDALGSPVAATDASGNLLWRETYRPYGERLNNQSASGNNPLWYTGKRQDPETGLVYMGARYYNPMLGRFLSIDPIEPDENNLHSLNRYAYANNNPYKFVDPDGQAAETVIDVISLGLSIKAWRQDPSFVNALAVAYDGFATAIPVLPAGIGILRQASSKGSEITQAVRQAADGGAARVGEKSVAGAAKGGAASAKQGADLSKHFGYAEKYGKGGVKELGNGRIRYYGETQPANKAGEMAGRRYVHEFDPATGRSRGWHETVAHSGNVRQVRPELNNGSKTHYQFDGTGRYTGSW